MAYSDYAASVFKNGEQVAEYEDAYIYDNGNNTDEWQRACKELSADDPYKWLTSIHHGIMGDDDIRVICHKQQIPDIYELTDGVIQKVEIPDGAALFNWGRVSFIYKGYVFDFVSGEPYDDDSPCIADMITPDGDRWHCRYDYYG